MRWTSGVFFQDRFSKLCSIIGIEFFQQIAYMIFNCWLRQRVQVQMQFPSSFFPLEYDTSHCEASLKGSIDRGDAQYFDERARTAQKDLEHSHAMEVQIHFR